MGDPFLNYFALGLLVFVVTALFFGVIAIHDVPHMIAKSRNHPHQDAIHAAGWVSLFMLHVLWPFLWIWAMAYRPERGWGFKSTGETPASAAVTDELAELRRRIAGLEAHVRIDGKQRPPAPAPAAAPLAAEFVTEVGGR